jgi:hypothetical protein
MFKKDELRDITDELGVESDKLTVREMLLAISNNLEEEGIPEVEDCSDALFEFLLNSMFIDDDGNILEQAQEVNVDEVIPESEPEAPEENLPECFTHAEPRDPACARCIVYDECYVQRLILRPKCFGKLFDVNAEECRNCLEFDACRIESS